MMLEVEGFRRRMHPSGFLQHGNTELNRDQHVGLYYPTIPTIHRQEKQNPFMDWGQKTCSPPPMSVESKSDGEEDDDEYRPFTPPPPRERLSYTRYQLELLNGIYAKVRYPNSSQKQLIAKRVGITREQVKIWFQNRRRKDVICKDKKPEDENNKSKDKSEEEISDVSKSASDTESISGDDVTSQEEGSMVPPVVMKGVINELKRFENEPPKGKKKKKSKSMKQRQMKKNIANAILHSSYDMISPPNQVIPKSQGLVNRSTNKLNHSTKSSAFESPKDSQVPKYPTTVSTFLEHFGIHGVNPTMHHNQQPFPVQGHSGLGQVHTGCDLPVLADLLSFKAGLESRTDDTLINSNTSPRSMQSNRQNSCDNQGSISMPYGINRFYPFPFIAEQPLLLSTLRHSDSFRHHILPHTAYPEEQSAFQAIPISALNNPYYSPTSSVAWSNQTQTMPPSNFTQL